MVNNREITFWLAFPVIADPLINGGDIQQHFKTGLVIIFEVAKNLYQPVTSDPKRGHALCSVLTDKLALAEFPIQGIYDRR